MSKGRNYNIYNSENSNKNRRTTAFNQPQAIENIIWTPKAPLALRIRNFIIEHYDPGTPADPAYVSADQVIDNACARADDQTLSDQELAEICKQVIKDAEEGNAYAKEYDEYYRWLRKGGARFEVIEESVGPEDLLASIQAFRKKGIPLPAILVNHERYIHDTYVKFRNYCEHIDLPAGLSADALFEKAGRRIVFPARA
jgi:hypothetical protein